jgi:cytochrome c biogenesis protein CcdA
MVLRGTLKRSAASVALMSVLSYVLGYSMPFFLLKAFLARGIALFRFRVPSCVIGRTENLTKQKKGE